MCYTMLTVLPRYHDSSSEAENPLREALMHPPAVNDTHTLHLITLHFIKLA